VARAAAQRVRATGRRSLRFCELIRSALAAILSTGKSARFTRKEPPPTASAATTGSTTRRNFSHWRR